MGGLFLTLCGILWGLIYDFFRAVRKKLYYNTAVSVICDLLFGITATILSVYTMYIHYSLELRFYRICGMVCACVIYFLLFSHLILKIYSIFLDFFGKILKILFTIIKFCAKIFKKCFLFVFFPFLWVGKHLKKIILKIRFKLLQQLKFIKRK